MVPQKELWLPHEDAWLTNDKVLLLRIPSPKLVVVYEATPGSEPETIVDFSRSGKAGVAVISAVRRKAPDVGLGPILVDIAASATPK